MPNSFGSGYSEDRPLPVEQEPVAIIDRLGAAAGLDEKGRRMSTELSHAEQQKVEAELWKEEHGFTRRHLKSALKAFRSMPALEGYERYLTRKLAGEISGSPQITRYKRDLAVVRAEMRRWRAKGQTMGAVPKEKPLEPRRQQRKSPGRPRNASRRVTLPQGGTWVKKAAA